MSRPNLFLIVGLAVYTLAMRLMPYALSHFGVEIEPEKTFYPWNFSPMSAFCLFFGAAYFTLKSWAYLMPIVILFAGDLGIWMLTGKIEWAFHKNMAAVYGSYLIIAYLGTWLREKRTLQTIWFLGISGEVLFFLITNFGTWMFSPMYAKTAAGLMECYLFALPFFGKSLASTLFFSTVIFSPFLRQERKQALKVSESRTIAT